MKTGFKGDDFVDYRGNLVNIVQDTFPSFSDPYYLGRRNPKKEMAIVRANAIARTLTKKARTHVVAVNGGTIPEVKNAFVAPVGSGRRR